MIKWVVRAASLVAILNSFVYLNIANATPTLKDYGSLPEVEHVAMSPSGNLVAFHRVTAEYDRIIVVSLATNKQIRVMDVAKTSPDSIRFLSEDKLALVMSKMTYSPNFEPFLLSTAYLLDITGGSIRQLLIPGEPPVVFGQTGLGDILGVSPDGKYAYMPAITAKEKRGSPMDDGVGVVYHSLLKVNLNEKNKVPIIIGKENREPTNYFLDNNGNVIAQVSYNEHSNIHKVSAYLNDNWVDVFKEKIDIPTKGFVGVTPDFKSLVFLETNIDKGRTAYYTMLLADGTISSPLFSRDDADIEAVISNAQGIVLGVRYSGFIPSYQFFDPALNQKVKDILASFPEHAVYLYNLSPDLKNFLVNVQGSSAPSDYYLISEGKPPQFLTSSYPQIKPSDLNPIGKVTFKARDDLKIPTLLTIPKDKVGAMKNLPAIIMPHGGPEEHDRIRFDWLAQAFASNGYLVIQPQFRGSDGFGAKHTQAGYGEWGKKMQDDVTDAVDFAVKKGMIDPNRICIVGASYGGYAALAGGAFTPDLYKCVVSLAGIGHLKHMLDSDKSKNGRDSYVVDYMKRQFTNSEDDTKKMAAASPELFAENFKAPVLLIHGNEDKRVPIDQSKDMKSALKSAKKDVTFVELDKEDHYLSHTETRLQALEEMVKFVNAKIGK